MYDLTMEVGEFDCIGVDDGEMGYTGSGEVEEESGSESSCSHDFFGINGMVLLEFGGDCKLDTLENDTNKRNKRERERENKIILPRFCSKKPKRNSPKTDDESNFFCPSTPNPSLSNN